MNILKTLRCGDIAVTFEYSLAATFLGRMALSGDLLALASSQWKLVQSAMGLYREAVPIIRDSVSLRHGTPAVSYRHPEGWQTVVRQSGNGRSLLVVTHRFGGRGEDTWDVPLPPGAWKIAARFGAGAIRLRRGRARICLPSPFSAQVALLETLDQARRCRT